MPTVRIVLQIRPQGEIVLQTHGVTGPQCREIARFLRESLGSVQEEHRTPEFYHSEVLTEHTEHETGRDTV